MSQNISKSTFSALKNIDDFELLEEIGSGSYGNVYLVIHKKTKQKYAAKVSKFDISDINPSEKNDLEREININSKIYHPAIINFYGYTLTDFEHRDRIVIITKYASNGALRNFIISENKSLSCINWNITKKLIIIYGICAAMSFLHSHDIIHRDLKAENVLLDEYLFPIITDFGLSKSLNDKAFQSVSGFKGTIKYASPEALRNGKQNKSSDVYAFAFLAYELMTATDPFENCKDIYKIYANTANNVRPDLELVTYESYRELIKSCWDMDPLKRPSFDEIVERLKNDRGFITDDVDENEFIKYVDYIDNTKKAFDDEKLDLPIENGNKRKSQFFRNYPVIHPQMHDAKSNKNDSNSPKADFNSPKVDSNSPKVDSNSPKVDFNSPKVDSNSPKVDLNSPTNNSGSNNDKNKKFTVRKCKFIPNSRVKSSGFANYLSIQRSRLKSMKRIIIDLSSDSDSYSNEEYYDEEENHTEKNENKKIKTNESENEQDFNDQKNKANEEKQNVSYQFSRSLPRIDTYKFHNSMYKYDLIKYPVSEINKLSIEHRDFAQNAECDPQLQFLMATYLIKGENGFPKNTHLGLQYLKHSIHGDCVDSILYYCEMLTNESRIIPKDVEKAKKLLKRSHKLNDSRLYLFYARLLIKENNILEAKKYLHLATHDANADAQYELGLIYLKENSTEDAINYLQMSKKNGNKKALLFCNIVDELNDIHGFSNLPNSTKNFFYSKIFTYCTNADCLPNTNLKSVPIYINNETTKLFFKNKTFQNYSFDNILKYFDQISIEIKYPSKKYENIFENISIKKLNLKPSLNVIIFITKIKEIKKKFGPDTVINRMIIDSSVQSIENENIDDDFNGCFCDCYSLNEVIIHSSLSSIADCSFARSSIMQITIPKSVTVIAERCFYDCKSLNNIIIPSSVTSINNKAFFGCSSLIHLSIPLSVTFIGDECFEDCTALEKIESTLSLIDIGAKAFYNCSSLKSFIIPSSIKTIGNMVFYGCNCLQNVSMPHILLDLVSNLGINDNVNINIV